MNVPIPVQMAVLGMHSLCCHHLWNHLEQRWTEDNWNGLPSANVVLDHLVCPCRLGWKVRKNLERYLESNYIYLCVCMLSHIWLFATPWIIACQASLFMEFLRQEYWSGLPFPSSGDLPNPGIKPESPALQMDSLLLSHWGSPQLYIYIYISTN